MAATYTFEGSGVVGGHGLIGGGGLIGGSGFWQQGGSIDLSADLYRGFGAAADVAGLHTANVGGGVALSTVTATFGPRYTWRPASKKISLFGEAMAGVAHGFDGVFPSTTGSQSSANAIAMQVGGGLDWRMTRHIGLRLIQGDWVRTQFPNSTTNIQNNMKFSTGVVYRFQR